MHCVLCGKVLLSTVSTVDAKSSKPLNVVICHGCGLVQQDPIPSQAHLHNFYTHHYRIDYKGTYAPQPKHIYRAGMAAADRVNFLQQNGIDGGKVLDIGAGSGEFVYISRARGYDTIGVEPNIGYSEFAKAQYGVEVVTGDFREIRETYQVITMFHVLEHLPDPVHTFKTLWSLLTEGGHLCVEVPNIEASDASPHNIFFKAHLFYFSGATLTACASPYFEPVATDRQSNLRVLFRKRRHIGALILPHQDNVGHTIRRLRQKGWVEYLFLGGGLLKGIKKLKQLVNEVSLHSTSGKNILDAVLGVHSNLPDRVKTVSHRQPYIGF